MINPAKILLLACAAGTAMADFHLGFVTWGGASKKFAVSSNSVNCDAITGVPSGSVSRIIDKGDPTWREEKYLRLKSGLCGAPTLDFYKQSDGSYKGYIAGGSGNVEATCQKQVTYGSCWNDYVSYGLVYRCSSRFCR